MTRSTLRATLERNWHVVALSASLATALGFRWVSPLERIGALEARVSALESAQRESADILSALALDRCLSTTDIRVRIALDCARREGIR